MWRALLFLTCATAYADEPAPIETAPAEQAPVEPTPAEPSLEELTPAQLTAQARVAARRGQCRELPALAQRVRALDAAYYEANFANDAQIRDCVPATDPPRLAPSAGSGAMAVDAANDAREGEKSVMLAGMLSIGIPLTGLLLAGGAASAGATNKQAATGLGIAAAAMLVIGPTTGHIYAGDVWTRGLKWRLITLAVGAGTVVVFGATDGSPLAGVAALGFVVAGAGYVGATVVEMIDAPRVVARANAQRPSAQVVPMIPNGPGLSLVGRF